MQSKDQGLILPSCLRSASDAKERQHWVSRLQICTQHHTEAMGKVGAGPASLQPLFWDGARPSPSPFPQSNPPPGSRSYSVASQSSASSPMSVRRPSQNANALFGWPQSHKGSSLYSSKKSLVPDHLLDAREVSGGTRNISCRVPEGSGVPM